jgi:hypothetical protein
LPNVTEIGAWAFADCTRLTSIELPNVTYIRESAFSDCASLTSVVLPNVTKIEESTFSGCANLASVALSVITIIGDGAFPDGVKIIPYLGVPAAPLRNGTWEEIANASAILNSLTALCDDGRLDELRKRAKYTVIYARYNLSHMLSDRYGEANCDALEKVEAFESADADRAFDSSNRDYENFPSNGFMDEIEKRLLCGVTFDKTAGIETYLSFVWHYAFHKPHDAGRFNKAVEMYQHYAGIEYTDKYGKSHEVLCLDCLLATLHKSALMGDGVLTEMRGLIDGWADYFVEKNDSVALANLASGLKWIGGAAKTAVAEKFEFELLKKMASSGVGMSQELQDRIQFIEKMAKIFDYAPEVKNAAEAKSEGLLPIENQAMQWDEKRLLSFFALLNYQKKNLDYALTMDLWEPDEDIPIAPGANFDVEAAYANIEADIASAFGDEVICERQEAAFLLPTGYSKIEGRGLLLRRMTKDGLDDYAGLYAIIVPIGLRRLTIQIYTLYLSQGKDAITEGQQAVILKQNSNPVHGRITRALRDTVLQSIDQTANRPPDPFSFEDGE